MCRRFRPAWVEVELPAIAANVAELCRLVAPARVCAVVKADAYGHGAPAVARAALAGGASLLAVALVEEGVALRESGIEAPVLLLSEPTGEGIAEAVARRLILTCYRQPAVRAAGEAASAQGVVSPVQVKVDTGMHRVGADPDEVAALAEAVLAEPALALAGLWTHLAVAEVPEDPFTALQLARLGDADRRLRAAGIRVPLLHAANSAGAIAHPAARLDLVRCGIACYGYAPSPGLPGTPPLRPALSLKARVHLVRQLDAGEATSYGRRYRLERRSRIAVVPLGYHDGVPRRLFPGGEVLIGGRRRRVAGTVTMDQLLVDCGADDDVAPGDEVVLLGRQGDEQVTAEDWARLLGTISYEVLCGIGPRVPRLALGEASLAEPASGC